MQIYKDIDLQNSYLLNLIFEISNDLVRIYTTIDTPDDHLSKKSSQEKTIAQFDSTQFIKCAKLISELSNKIWNDIYILLDTDRYMIYPKIIDTSDHHNLIYNSDNSAQILHNIPSEISKMVSLSFSVEENLLLEEKIDEEISSLFCLSEKVWKYFNECFFLENISVAHIGNISLRNSLKNIKKSKDSEIFVYVYARDTSVYITIFNQKKLIFHNRFYQKSIDEIIYFIFATSEVLKLPEENINFVISKNSNNFDNIYSEITSYYENVTTI